MRLAQGRQLKKEESGQKERPLVNNKMKKWKKKKDPKDPVKR